MEALKSAQEVMNSIETERLALKALPGNNPHVSERNYKLGEDVLVYSDIRKEWLEPFDVFHVEGRTVSVENKS